MAELNQRNRLVWLSLGILILGWLCVGALLMSGMDARYSASWWVSAAAFLCLIFSPVAGLLAVGGMIFGAPKRPALLALSLSIVSTLVILRIRP